MSKEILNHNHMRDRYLTLVLLVGVVVLSGILWLSLAKPRSIGTREASVGLQNLPSLEETQVVQLHDGDTFEMKAEIVKQVVGNRTIRRLAYNRQIPGPILEVAKGDAITLRFTNLTDMPTTLHSHGLRLENRFDGVPDSMHGAQKEIAPGEGFEYTLTFPDAGLYWYHPHMREDYEQEMGLYGNYLVQEAGYWNPVDQESFLVFDDFSENDPFYTDTVNKTLMGRYGNLLLINNEKHYQLTVKQHAVTRLYLTNTANARPFLLSFPGAKVKLVGGDQGRIEKEIWVDQIILAPAERAVVEVMYPEAGNFSILQRGTAMGAVVVEAYATQTASSFEHLRSNADDYHMIRDRMEQWISKAPDKKLRTIIEMQGMGMGGNMPQMMHGTGVANLNDPTAGIEWEDTMVMMNQMSTDKNVTWKLVDMNTGKANDSISDWIFRKGDLVKVEIFNDPHSAHPMQHPIHFHGQRFVVLSRNTVPNDDLQWKDTALIRPGETVDLLVEMSNPGTWLAHCHIAEHMHAGMMFAFTVK